MYTLVWWFVDFNLANGEKIAKIKHLQNYQLYGISIMQQSMAFCRNLCMYQLLSIVTLHEFDAI